MSFVGSWHKKWYTALDEALTIYLDNSATTDYTKIWNNNNALMQALVPVRVQTCGSKEGPQTIDQFSFLRDYEGDLDKAEELTYLYNRDSVDSDAEDDRGFPDETNVKRVKEIVEIYSNVIGRLERQLKAPVRAVVPLTKRKRDIVYFIYFLIHIPVIICKSLIHSCQPYRYIRNCWRTTAGSNCLMPYCSHMRVIVRTTTHCFLPSSSGLTPSSRRRSSASRTSSTPSNQQHLLQAPIRRLWRPILRQRRYSILQLLPDDGNLSSLAYQCLGIESAATW